MKSEPIRVKVKVFGDKPKPLVKAALNQVVGAGMAPALIFPVGVRRCVFACLSPAGHWVFLRADPPSKVFEWTMDPDIFSFGLRLKAEKELLRIKANAKEPFKLFEVEVL